MSLPEVFPKLPLNVFPFLPDLWISVLFVDFKPNVAQTVYVRVVLLPR